MPRQPEEPSIDDWEQEALANARKLEQDRIRTQRQRAYRLLQTLRQTELPGRLNYEVTLVGKVLEREPFTRDDHVFLDAQGKPIIQYSCAVDDDFSGSTQNGFNEGDHLANAFTKKIAERFEEADLLPFNPEYGWRIGFLSTQFLDLGFPDVGDASYCELLDWDIVLTLADGTPLQLNKQIISTVIIHPETDEQAEAQILSQLAADAERYWRGEF